MQVDFHYYCVGALAKLSGFPENEALTIAYASQYVDDSTESEPIQVGDIIFDTVRTAHTGLRSFDWDVQKKIYIPFHFLPPKPLSFSEGSYVVKPDSVIADNLFTFAARETDPLTRLCFIGTTIHTIADLTSHQGFSGRRSKENSVDSISVLINGNYKKLLWQNLMYDVLPEVGHAEAGYFPDQSFAKWKYKNNAGKTVIRNNSDEFRKAAKRIYKKLCGVSPEPGCAKPWVDVDKVIAGLLADQESDLKKRCAKWKAACGKYFKKGTYHYDKYEWRKNALGEKDTVKVAWDAKSPAAFTVLCFKPPKDFFDKPWVKFHRAALRHRHFILENIM